MDKKDKFTFGMHRGETLGDVLDEDPGYVLWCVRKGLIDISLQLYEEARFSYQEVDRSDGEYYIGCPDQD